MTIMVASAARYHHCHCHHCHLFIFIVIDILSSSCHHLIIVMEIVSLSLCRHLEIVIEILSSSSSCHQILCLSSYRHLVFVISFSFLFFYFSQFLHLSACLRFLFIGGKARKSAVLHLVYHFFFVQFLFFLYRRSRKFAYHSIPSARE